MNPITRQLITWYSLYKRNLPWRQTKDPYCIWLSEIILQQTRVDQGLPYYLRFIQKYPTLDRLAEADDQEVYKLWQGLGYYSRAANMLRTARILNMEYNGVFPADFNELKKLPGIGNYTAAAISSIAYDLPHAVVDGNVYRVLSRLFEIDTPVNSGSAYDVFYRVSQDLLSEENPAEYNQAVMELGALVCKPKNPLCVECPLSELCRSFNHQTMQQFPVKNRRQTQKEVFLNYFILADQDEQYTNIVIQQRPEKGIWASLFEFPLVELSKELSTESVVGMFAEKYHQNPEIIKIVNVSGIYRHVLSHRVIQARFITLSSSVNWIQAIKKPLFLVPKEEIGSFPVSVLIEKYLAVILGS